MGLLSSTGGVWLWYLEASNGDTRVPAILADSIHEASEGQTSVSITLAIN